MPHISSYSAKGPQKMYILGGGANTEVWNYFLFNFPIWNWPLSFDQAALTLIFLGELFLKKKMEHRHSL